MAKPKPSALDRPAARVVAALVALGCVAALAYIHRDDLFPPQLEQIAAPDDPVIRCVAERVQQIEALVAEGTFSEEQGQSFAARAEAMCRAQAGGQSEASPPGVRPPGAPPVR